MCGILALYSNQLKPISIDLYNMFQLLQHRGQDGSGIVTSNLKSYYTTYSLGAIKNLSINNNISKLYGHIGLAHNRYPTSGKSNKLDLLQPWKIYNKQNNNIYYLAFNGTLSTKRQNINEYKIFNNIIGNEISIGNGLKKLLNTIPGTYSLIIMSKDSLYITRDLYGIRPLIIAKDNDKWIISSETCVLQNNCETIFEVNPGEIIRINSSGLEYIFRFKPKNQSSFCIFEYIYFSRPDSILESTNEVYKVRVELGKQLAIECKKNTELLKADYVIGVPNSSVPHAIGFSQEIGIPYCSAFIRNNTHRTFILSDQKSRKEQVSLKFSCLPLILKNKSVIIIDDSIVRGNTITHLVKLLRNRECNKIHVAIASPPIINQCYMGMDITTPENLIAHNKNIQEIKKFINVDSLTYLSLSGLIQVQYPKSNYCTACLSGNYPKGLLDW